MFLHVAWFRLAQGVFCLCFSGVGSDCFMVFLKKGKDGMAVLDFVSAWVSVGSNSGNLELVCMDASLDVGGAPRSKGTEDSDHRIEGDDDKFACISKVCMVNSEVCHATDVFDFCPSQCKSCM